MEPLVSRNSVVVGKAQPDLSFNKFQAVLKDNQSPAFPYALDCYNRILKWKVSVAFMLGIIRKESTFGKFGFAPVNLSLGNTRSTVLSNGIVHDTVQGYYVRYKSWADGVEDAAARLVIPTYFYAKEGRITINQIIYRYAPPSDKNDTEKYISDLIEWMNEWIGESNMAPSYDYYNLNIIDKTGELVYNGKTGSRGIYKIKEVVLHETAGPNDAKNATGAQAVALDNATLNWFLKTDNQLSIHYFLGGENNGAPVYRCCPESVMAYHAIGDKGVAPGGSVDNHISIGIERMGQPNDGPVGPKQTAALCKLVLDICNRNGLTADAIVSHASIQSDKRDGNTIIGLVKDYVKTNLGVDKVSNTTNGPAVPTGNKVNGHVLAHGMLDYWNKVNVPGVQHPLGLPVSEEQDWTDPTGKKFVIQVFERGVLGYDGSIADPAYRVQGLIIGPEWMQGHLKAA